MTELKINISKIALKDIDAIKKNNFRVPILKKNIYPFCEKYLRVSPPEYQYIYVNHVLDYLLETIQKQQSRIQDLINYNKLSNGENI